MPTDITHHPSPQVPPDVCFSTHRAYQSAVSSTIFKRSIVSGPSGPSSTLAASHDDFAIAVSVDTQTRVRHVSQIRDCRICLLVLA
jgi:hypothetical protein